MQYNFIPFHLNSFTNIFFNAFCSHVISSTAANTRKLHPSRRIKEEDTRLSWQAYIQRSSTTGRLRSRTYQSSCKLPLNSCISLKRSQRGVGFLKCIQCSPAISNLSKLKPLGTSQVTLVCVNTKCFGKFRCFYFLNIHL